jgi:phosphomannomutase
LDGDADQIVYFRMSSPDDNRVDLVDNDKILSLFALFIREKLDIINKDDNCVIVPANLDSLMCLLESYYDLQSCTHH